MGSRLLGRADTVMESIPLGIHHMQIRTRLRHITSAATIATMIAAQANAAPEAAGSGSYQDLVALFAQWRAFEQPPDREGAPDYTAATFAKRHEELKDYQQRLAAINPGSWPVEQRIDHQLLRAELNGMDFYIRVLQPWAREIGRASCRERV